MYIARPIGQILLQQAVMRDKIGGIAALQQTCEKEERAESSTHPARQAAFAHFQPIPTRKVPWEKGKLIHAGSPVAAPPHYLPLVVPLRPGPLLWVLLSAIRGKRHSKGYRL